VSSCGLIISVITEIYSVLTLLSKYSESKVVCDNDALRRTDEYHALWGLTDGNMRLCRIYQGPDIQVKVLHASFHPMENSTSEFKLTQGIISLSDEKSWDKAKLEWELLNIYWIEEPQTCLCGHYPINEICVLTNKKNGKTVEVGNCCVKKFLGLDSDKIFQCIKRVRKDITKGLNAETIQYAYNEQWVSLWEKDFLFDTARKRKLSPKQLAKRMALNRKVLRSIVRPSQKVSKSIFEL